MIFNSVTFLLFFVAVTLLYWALPSKPRYWLLFISSLIFYAFWRWEYLSVLLLSAVTDYFVARAISDTPIEHKKRRKQLLAVSLTVNLGLLFYFKYLLFFTSNFNALFEQLGTLTRLPYWDIILPFGISFYTFETISYTMDVYRGHIKAEKKFITYGLFVAFFPKLVAGPIQRAAELVEQLKQRPNFKIHFVVEGVKRMIYGLFLKVIFADNISPLVDEGFAMNPDSLAGLDVITLSFLFGFQIYFDFAAYSHIALGAAKVLGDFNSRKFQLSLHRHIHERFLEALAHFPLLLDPGLPVSPPDRNKSASFNWIWWYRAKPQRSAHSKAEKLRADCNVGNHGVLARSKLDLHFMGAVPCHIHSNRAEISSATKTHSIAWISLDLLAPDFGNCNGQLDSL